MSTIRVIETTRGPARVHLDRGRHALLVLGHGAGGGVDARDLLAARAAARDLGMSVARVEQPWRVAGRRVAAPPARLDEAWLAVVPQLRHGGPLIVGGRSAGARVACRTAETVHAAAVLALAFPLVPPGRATSRDDELRRPPVPRLVVQGSRDAFGIPAAGNGVRVAVVDGADHAFAVRQADRRSQADVLTELRELVRDWLQTVT